jgi:hypothetical protein
VRSRRTTIIPIEKSVLVPQFGLMMTANKRKDLVTDQARATDLVSKRLDTVKKTEDLQDPRIDARTDARTDPMEMRNQRNFLTKSLKRSTQPFLRA